MTKKGDLNARTSEHNDFCEILNDKEDIYLNLPDDDMDSNLSICKRHSQDKVTNANGSDFFYNFVNCLASEY